MSPLRSIDLLRELCVSRLLSPIFVLIVLIFLIPPIIIIALIVPALVLFVSPHLHPPSLTLMILSLVVLIYQPS